MTYFGWTFAIECQMMGYSNQRYESFDFICRCLNINFLSIPDSYDAKVAKLCNLWTLCPAIKAINHLFKIQQELKPFLCFCWILKRMFNNWITGQDALRMYIFASQLSGILKRYIELFKRGNQLSLRGNWNIEIPQ